MRDEKKPEEYFAEELERLDTLIAASTARRQLLYVVTNQSKFPRCEYIGDDIGHKKTMRIAKTGRLLFTIHNDEWDGEALVYLYKMKLYFFVLRPEGKGVAFLQEGAEWDE